nr:serine/threonine-protein kinase pakD-like isoform X1 [Penaeus vannamei]XP_027218374.1 serine/threonine-protein kinase pakD-like isoform X1 [Penaeus vannamei]
MASKRNARNKVIHRQTFQNSNQMVELTVKTIPKQTVQNEVSKFQPTFVRDCALRKELQKVVDDKNNNVSDKNAERKAPGKYSSKRDRVKSSNGRVTVEVIKSKSKRDHHEVVSHNATWEEMLHSCSTITTCSDIDATEDSSILELTNNMRNAPSKTARQPPVRIDKENTKRNLTRAQIQLHNQQNQSVQTSFVSPYQQNVTNNQSQNRQGNKRSVQEEYERPRTSEVRNTRSVAVETDPDNIRSNVQGGHTQRVNAERVPSNRLQQPEQQSSNRLLSDDVNSSPFGESALQLLHQLRERLNTRGDSEGSNMVGVLEAFIGMRGSMGSVGTGNPGFQTDSASPLYTTVFQTPSSQPTSYGISQHPGITRCQQLRQEAGQPSCRNAASQQQNQQHQPTSQNPQANKRQENDLESKEASSDKTNSHREKDMEQLKRVIEHQRRIISEQENNIQELKTLSAHILAQKEEFLQAAQTHQNDKESRTNPKKDSTPTQSSAQNRDSGYGFEEVGKADTPVHSEDNSTEEEESRQPGRKAVNKQRKADRALRSSLLQLQTENQILRREVQSNRDLILNLENQLTRAYKEIDSERQSRSGLSISRLSGSAPNLDLIGHRNEAVSTKSRTNKRTPSVLGESEADSAYEEKSGSHLTSKINSPHSDGQQGKDSTIGSLRSLPIQSREIPERERTTVATTHDIPTDTALLQTGYIGKEMTVPHTLMNAATIPTSQFLLQNPVLTTQGNDYGETKESAGKVAPTVSEVSDEEKGRQKSSKPSRQLNNSRQAPLPKKGLDGLGIKISDLDPKPVVVLQDPTFTSFSTVSEQSYQESVLTCENSFLEGIAMSRHASKPNSRVASPANLNNTDHSSVELHPLESTRVKASFHTLSESHEFVALKGNETSTSSEFNSVEELE